MQIRSKEIFLVYCDKVYSCLVAYQGYISILSSSSYTTTTKQFIVCPKASRLTLVCPVLSPKDFSLGFISQQYLCSSEYSHFLRF